MDKKLQLNDVLPTQEDIRFFQNNGYWVSKKIIDDERLEELKARMERMYREEFETGRTPWVPYWKNGDNPRALRKSDNTHLADRCLYALATDPVIARVSAELMQAEALRLFVTQLLYKPGRGTEGNTANVGWHQDLSYWNCAKEPTIFTAWVAFDDTTIDNGCMKMMPESHRWGLINVNDFFNQNLKEQEAEMNLPEGKTFNPVPIIMKAGQISFHHALTIHGSGPNVSNGPRRSMAIHLMTNKTRYQHGTYWDAHPFLPSMHTLQDNDPIEGDDFPIVYDAVHKGA